MDEAVNNATYDSVYRKSKTNITISEEEFKGMIQRYKESKKQEN